MALLLATFDRVSLRHRARLMERPSAEAPVPSCQGCFQLGPPPLDRRLTQVPGAPIRVWPCPPPPLPLEGHLTSFPVHFTQPLL